MAVSIMSVARTFVEARSREVQARSVFKARQQAAIRRMGLPVCKLADPSKQQVFRHAEAHDSYLPSLGTFGS